MHFNNLFSNRFFKYNVVDSLNVMTKFPHIFKAGLKRGQINPFHSNSKKKKIKAQRKINLVLKIVYVSLNILGGSKRWDTADFYLAVEYKMYSILHIADVITNSTIRFLKNKTGFSTNHGVTSCAKFTVIMISENGHPFSRFCYSKEINHCTAN